MKLIRYLCVLLSIFSCNHPHTISSNINYKSYIIKQIIESFIQSTKESTSIRVITVELKNHSDTSIVSIANSYPDLRKIKFIGSDTLSGYRVYFVGETNSNIYQIPQTEKIPEEVLEVNRRLIDKNSPPPNFDPQQWILYFKDSSLIGFTPQEQIDKYLR
jgi:hypothetical protein